MQKQVKRRMPWFAKFFGKQNAHKAVSADTPPRDNGAEEKARARQAYYMKNFWDYDGSEQQDWEEA